MSKAYTMTILILLLASCLKLSDEYGANPPVVAPTPKPETSFIDFCLIQTTSGNLDTTVGNSIKFFEFGIDDGKTLGKINIVYGAYESGYYKVKYLINEDLVLDKVITNSDYIEFSVANKIPNPFILAYENGNLQNSIFFANHLNFKVIKSDSDTSIPDLVKKLNVLLRRSADTTINFQKAY
jgi:hypothetical protein